MILISSFCCCEPWQHPQKWFAEKNNLEKRLRKESVLPPSSVVKVMLVLVRDNLKKKKVKPLHYLLFTPIKSRRLILSAAFGCCQPPASLKERHSISQRNPDRPSCRPFSLHALRRGTTLTGHLTTAALKVNANKSAAARQFQLQYLKAHERKHRENDIKSCREVTAVIVFVGFICLFVSF